MSSLLKNILKTFPGRVLSRFGDQNWPLRSCDLTPLDFFLWGYLKSQVCQQAHNHPCIKGGDSTLHQRNSATFMQNGHGKFQQSRGGHLSDVLFHT